MIFQKLEKTHWQAEQPKRDDRKGFKNPLFPNDSVTTCSGFINEIRSHQKGDDVLYFVRVGLIQGSRKNDHDDWQGDITNCDLLVGSTLRKWAESMKQFKLCKCVGFFNGHSVCWNDKELVYVLSYFNCSIFHCDGHFGKSAYSLSKSKNWRNQ